MRRRRLGQVGERVERGQFGPALAVRVPVHRERDGRVTRQHLGGLRVDTAGSQVGDERVTQRVEVHDLAPGVEVLEHVGLLPLAALLGRISRLDPGFAGRAQVGSENTGHSGWGTQGKDMPTLAAPLDDSLEGSCRRRPKRQRVLPSTLAVGRGDRDEGRVGAEVEALAREAAYLGEPQARLARQAIEQRPFAAGHPRADGLVLGAIQEPPEFVVRERPALASTLGLGVEFLEMGDGRPAGTAVSHHPATEGLDGAEVVVEGLDADARFPSAKFAQAGLHLACGDVRVVPKAAAIEDLAHPSRRQRGVAGRVALGLERVLVVVHMIAQPLVGGDALCVDEADSGQTLASGGGDLVDPSLQRRVGLAACRRAIGDEPVDAASELLARRLARERGDAACVAVVVTELDVPALRLAGLALSVTVA